MCVLPFFSFLISLGIRDGLTFLVECCSYVLFSFDGYDT